MKIPELNKQYAGKYIGPHKIAKIDPAEDKTYMGNPKVLVTYEKGGDWVYPVKALESIVTDDVSTASGLQTARLKPVIAEIMAVLLEADLTIDDAFKVEGAVMRKVYLSLDDAIARAFNKLLGKEIHFNTVRGEVTLTELDDMLMGRLVVGRLGDKDNKKET